MLRILVENKRRKKLLNEISVKEVLSTVGSKATRKKVYQFLISWIKQRGRFYTGNH